MHYIKKFFRGFFGSMADDVALLLIFAPVGVVLMILGTLFWEPLVIAGIVVILLGLFLSGFGF